VNLAQLLWHCVPEIREIDVSRPGRIDASWYAKTSLLTESFSRLTLRSDLSFLTFDVWQDAIAGNGFRTPIQQWCPLCLKDDPYERLIWSLKPMESCDVHGARLVQSCSSCHNPSYPRTTKAPWLYCPSCRFDRRDDPVVPSSRNQDWTTRQLKTLAFAGQQGARPEKDRLYRIWQEVILPHFSSGCKAKAYLGLTSRPRSGKASSIETLLRYCECLTLDLDKVLLENPKKLKRQLRMKPAKLNRVRLPAGDVISRITQVLDESINRPMTLRMLCKKAGTSRAMLIQKFPALQQKLIRYFHDQRKEKASAVQRDRLHRAVQFIRERGQKVTLKEVLYAVGDHNHEKGWATKFFSEARKIAASDVKFIDLAQQVDPCAENKV
jgi:AraC-like DNA-binding protein